MPPPPRPRHLPPLPDAAGLRAAIRDEARRLGFCDIGFAAVPADPAQRARQKERLATFLAGGLHGDMGWMAGHADRRAAPEILWPEAQTLISLAFSYAPDHDPLAVLGRPMQGAISVYAQGRDYHDVVKGRLKQLGRFIHDRFGIALKVFVDTAPLMEKPAAERAGLGWQGKHTNLVSRRFGSWLFLGEILLAQALPADAPEADHCGSCRACLDICPTSAFPAPYRLDPRRCISYLTIEHKGPIPRELRAAMGNRIYGCDDCLAVCPWNKFAQTAGEAARDPALTPRAELAAPDLVALAALDDAGFRRRFAGTAIKRTGRDRFVRNVAIALGNGGGAADALPAIERLLGDASPLVRGAAVWALSRLAGDPAFATARAARVAGETDPGVVAEWHAGPAAGREPT